MDHMSRRTRWSGYLPNWEECEREADHQLSHILNGLTLACTTSDGDSAFLSYYYQLQKYIERFYHRYPKDVHVKLIELVYLGCCRIKQQNALTMEAYTTLKALIGGSRLGRADLQLSWEPVWNLLNSVFFGKNSKISIFEPILIAREVKKFFPADCTPELWKKIQDYRSIEDSCTFGMISWAFLPTNLTLEQHSKDGAVVWFKDTWYLHSIMQMNGDFGYNVELFSKLVKHCPNFIDWTPYYDRLFTEVVRAMKLPRRRDKVAARVLQSCDIGTAHQEFIVYTYGGAKGCDQHLFRFFDYIAQELHPFYEDEHSAHALDFIHKLVKVFVRRYRRENVKPHRKDKIPAAQKLSAAKFRELVSKLLPLVLPALFNENATESWMDVPGIVAKLSLFAPEIVIPKVLETLYPSIGSLSEPHRLKQCLYLVSRLIIPISKGTFIVKELDKERKTINEFGEIVSPDRLPFLSSRSHLICILEEVVDLIDVSQIDRTREICSVLLYIFSVIPCIDISVLSPTPNASPVVSPQCSQGTSSSSRLTPEEAELARMTVRLVAIVDKVIDKILTMVEVICSPVPGNSTDVIGSLKDAKDNDNFTNYEDTFVDGCVFSCFAALATSAEKSVREKMSVRLCSLVLSSPHEHINAARIYSSIIAFLVTYMPETWTSLFTHVYSRLTGLLDAPTRAHRNLENTVLWYAQLLYPLCDVPVEIIHREKDKLHQVIALLLSCENKRVWRQGSQACSVLLYRLLSSFPSNEEPRKKMLDRSLAEWNPIHEWGRLYNQKTINFRWHVADAEDVKLANRFLSFMYENLKKLDGAEKMTKDHLEKSLSVIRSCFEQIVWNLPKMSAEGVASKVSAIPLTDDHLQDTKLVVIFPDGSNVRETLLASLERLLDFMLLKRADDVDTLRMLAAVLSFIVNPCASNMGDDQILSESVDQTQAFMQDPITRDGMFSFCEKAIHNEHTINMTRKRNIPYNKEQDRVIRMLCKLAVSRYEQVSKKAKTELEIQTSRYQGAQMAACDVLTKMLLDKNQEDQSLQPILETMITVGIGEHDHPAIRTESWKAILTMKELTFRPALEAFEMLSMTILENMKTNPFYVRKDGIEPLTALNDLSAKWYATLPKHSVWAAYKDNKGYEEGKQKWKTHVEKCKKIHYDLVATLHEFVVSPHLSPPRVELARRLLINCQDSQIDTATVQLCLRLLHNDKESQRIKAIGTLGKYLKKAKPKAKKKKWTCPRRPSDMSSFAHGIHSNCVTYVYDGNNLPKDENQWNNTIFIPKSTGVYSFPPTLSVTIPLSEGDPIARGPLDEKDQLIVEFFSNRNNIDVLVKFLLVEKNMEGDCKSFGDVAHLVKYLARNYPEQTVIVNNLSEILKMLFLSEKKEEQSLAIDILGGILRGTRHYPFSRLQEMWAWLQPALCTFVKRIRSDVEKNWVAMASKLTMDADLRQFWWFVELILSMANDKRSGITSRQLGIRFSSLNGLGWRYADVANRLVQAAWKNIPKAKMETDRASIAFVFMEVVSIELFHHANNFEGVPKNLMPTAFEILLEKFMAELQTIVDRSPPTAPSPTGQPSPQVSSTCVQSRVYSSLLKLQSTHSSTNSKVNRKRSTTGNNSGNNSGQNSGTNSPVTSRSPNNHVVRPAEGPTSPKLPRLDGVTVQSSASAVVAQALQSTGTPEDKSEELGEIKEKSLVYLRTLVDILHVYYSTHITPLTSGLIQLLPVLLVFATDDEYCQDEDTAIGEMRVKTTSLIFDHMAPCHLTGECADRLIETLHMTYGTSPTFRMKTAVIKYMQTSVTSNFYIYSTPQRKQFVRDTILQAMSDESIEVRKTAVQCLSSLLQRTFLTADEKMIGFFMDLLHDPVPSKIESGALGICAVVHATPPGYHTELAKLIPLLDTLCTLASSKIHKIREYCGNCLRAFRTGRREEWAESADIIGSSLAERIDNCGAPSYYA